MPLIYLETFIEAPQEVVFNLSRSVDLHKSSMKHHREEIIDGISAGLMEKGNTVTWQARHLFKNRKLKVILTELKMPHFFVDEMVKGDFKKMRHEHYFTKKDNATLMIDKFYFEAPFGILGKIVELMFLENYVTRLLRRRNKEIKHMAESDQWKQFLNR